MDEDDGDFTFAVAAPLAGSDGIFPGDLRIGAGRMYPVFGRPRSPPRRQAPEQEPETTTATARVPLGRVLLVDRERAGAAQPPYDEEPEKTRYFSWCPGLSAAAKPATCCRKSGSTGSLLQWSQRLLGRSHSDGKEKFVFLDAAGPSGSERKASGGGHVTAWSYYAKAGAGAGGSNHGGRRRSFLPYRQDLVGFFASPTAFRRSYHPF
ncbi:hypothetical protein QYE76_015382 [Lolium multiflorum]|uniref:Uncharacterized protein n=1 Tax=Lolium multiflorum TaxID=4521 RepID=A0AAD8U6S9_LOLMU|nr:hypothetical protein QYE76_015382 [Lolium multiflorum]